MAKTTLTFEEKRELAREAVKHYELGFYNLFQMLTYIGEIEWTSYERAYISNVLSESIEGFDVKHFSSKLSV
jgi:hypothetical protein